MSEIIYKFELQPGKNIIEINTLPRVLTVAEQNDKMFFWAAVTLEYEKRKIDFDVVGTGQSLEPGFILNKKYIGTIHCKNGLVWHVFANGHEIIKLV